MSKQIFHHFSLWEDYKLGFYNTSCENTKEHIEKSVILLSNQKTFEHFALRVINEWTFSCEHNFTDPSLNKIAYIGQSACCLANNTPSFVTRLAWSYVLEQNQILANETAKKVLQQWKEKHNKKGTLWENLD